MDGSIPESKLAGNNMNDAALSRIVYTTDVKGLSARQTPREETERREIMSVALAQPHRAGSSDPGLQPR